MEFIDQTLKSYSKTKCNAINWYLDMSGQKTQYILIEGKEKGSDFQISELFSFFVSILENLSSHV